jgi:hypothetical protein
MSSQHMAYKEKNSKYIPFILHKQPVVEEWKFNPLLNINQLQRIMNSNSVAQNEQMKQVGLKNSK